MPDPAARSEPITLLFVCLGNICRSPLARAIFDHLAAMRGLSTLYRTDSCGTGGWHAGAPADPRSALVAASHGVVLSHAARQVQPREDFRRFDLLLAMDRRNRSDLLALGAPSDKVRLVRSFDPALRAAAESDLDVPDPYYGAQEGFERVYAMLDASCGGLLDHLQGLRDGV